MNRSRNVGKVIYRAAGIGVALAFGHVVLGYEYACTTSISA
jgi:hypothetical protein